MYVYVYICAYSIMVYSTVYTDILYRVSRVYYFFDYMYVLIICSESTSDVFEASFVQFLILLE